MAFYDSVFYVNYGNGSSTGYYAVTVRPQNTAVAAGVLRRQFTAPAVGSERVFVCIVAGTTANTTDATWTTTRGNKTTDGTATWQECTGLPAVNGDVTNTATWTQAKAIGVPSLGAMIKRNNGASYQICTTAGTMAASEPSFSDTAGVTTNDGTSVWTCIGPVSNFTGGQAPFARLNTGFLNWAAGNTIYVGDNHAETQTASYTMNTGGSNSTVGKVLCHNHSGPYPPTASDLMTGASVGSTLNGFTISIGAPLYLYGMTFKYGIGLSGASSNFINSAASWAFFDNCSIELHTTYAGGSTACYIGLCSGSDLLILNNTTVRFGSALQYIRVLDGTLIWQNTGQILVAGSSVPNRLFDNVQGNNITLEALDLSQLNVALYNPLVVGNFGGSITVKDCKLNASVTVVTPQATGFNVQLIRCDSGATAYKSARYAYEGSETTETSITRVGGAVDPNGQAQSRKIVTTANVQWLKPFGAEPYAIWNTTTGANVTVTIYGTINSASLPLNDEIWIETEYLGTSASPLGKIVTSTKASFLSTGSAVASDSSSWNGGGSGAGWSPFKLTVTLSSPQPQLAGYIDVRVRAAKASATFYIDPKIELT